MRDRYMIIVYDGTHRAQIGAEVWIDTTDVAKLKSLFGTMKMMNYLKDGVYFKIKKLEEEIDDD